MGVAGVVKGEKESVGNDEDGGKWESIFGFYPRRISDLPKITRPGLELQNHIRLIGNVANVYQHHHLIMGPSCRSRQLAMMKAQVDGGLKVMVGGASSGLWCLVSCSLLEG
ncbi:hypothetical protein F0562_021663 [Nyssa sinensis]|uniref:Uncharacterized protein n=1 Tax=Nyssa sinensis TaxID=561372 RepID=A0A5J5BQW7_9ASTE|nr:hypothetical protein F0562_021663 [Nyssa sinensis]